MGCNCTKKNSEMKHVYTSPTGQTTVYRTEIEARAAKIRAGGGTVQSVPA